MDMKVLPHHDDAAAAERRACLVRARSACSCLTECVLSCQREAEDDVDSYQVPSRSLPAAVPPPRHVCVMNLAYCSGHVRPGGGAESRASASFIKHRLHKWMIISFTKPFFGSTFMQNTPHPWLSSQPSSVSPTLSRLSPRIARTNATVCFLLTEELLI